MAPNAQWPRHNRKLKLTAILSCLGCSEMVFASLRRGLDVLLSPVPAALAALLLSLLLFDAFPGDSMHYHLPFAVRFLQLPHWPDFSGYHNGRFEGFPRLWRLLLGPGLLTMRPRLFILPNLVSFAFLIAVCRRYLRLSAPRTICCCFAFPVVLFGFRSSLQDFFLNTLLLAAAIILFAPRSAPLQGGGRPLVPLLRWGEILALFCLGLAANVKYQGLFGACIIFAAWIVFRLLDQRRTRERWILDGFKLVVSFFLVVLIWAQPISNVVQFGNPVYPVRIVGLPGTERPTSSPIQYIPKLPLLSNAASYLVSVTEIDPIIRSTAGFNFQRSWHNHNLPKPQFLPGQGDYQSYILTGGSNGLLFVALFVMACLSLATSMKARDAMEDGLLQLRLRLMIVSVLFAFLPQSMELRYYMITLFTPALVAVSGQDNPWRQPSRYLVVVGVWFSLFAPFLVPVYFWLRTGAWINANGLLTPDVYRDLPPAKLCLQQKSTWGKNFVQTPIRGGDDARMALGCAFRLSRPH
jgi:hypothetical protein